MYLFTIALRSVYKHRRRSLFTTIAVAVSFTAMNLFSGYIHNVYAGLMDQAIRGEGLGDLTLARAGFFSDATLNPQKYLLDRRQLAIIADVLDHDPDTLVWMPRLAVAGMISNGRASTVFVADGLDPELEARMRGDFRPDRQGALDAGAPAGIAVASDLARQLDLKRDGHAVLFTTTVEGQMNALDADVRGIYNTGISATNDKSLRVPFAYAQRLLDTDGADRIHVRLKEGRLLPAARTRLIRTLQQRGVTIEIRSWSELSAFYLQVKSLFDTVFLFISCIVIIVVVMSIINTLTMTVMERMREIGTLRALGMKRRHIVQLFSAESLLVHAAVADEFAARLASKMGALRVGGAHADPGEVRGDRGPGQCERRPVRATEHLRSRAADGRPRLRADRHHVRLPGRARVGVGMGAVVERCAETDRRGAGS